MQLDKNYSLEYDSNNVILVFKEPRENKKKEIAEFRESMYYPNVQTALVSFLQKSLHGSESVEEVLRRITEVEQIIKNR